MKNKKWPKESVMVEASRYTCRWDFQQYSNSAYNAARKLKILDEACAHMEDRYEEWPLERIKEEAKKFKTRGDFQINGGKAYHAAKYRKDDYEEICAHMDPPKNIPYTFEELKEIASHYDTRVSFKRGRYGAYCSAVTHPKYEEICSHMKPSYTERFTLEELMLASSKYPTRSEFAKGSSGEYQASCKRSDFDIICSHMKYIKGTSLEEISLLNSIKEIYPSARKLKKHGVKIEGKPHIKMFELDILVPELNRAIEYDGEYWHSFDVVKKI